ncbi:Uncharacterized protein FWK35_00023203 [Aphis craccivora]|uniref:Uncharacterized protein n=1 Tax=Aphis craccivora TaxID=307492 RepID=A0A6G0Y017_APHCR|nr:Uncharacterized protein FWK35_00023203 [Aphis craccivora]
MHQISIYETNELTAFGFFNFDLKLIMSVNFGIIDYWNFYYATNEKSSIDVVLEECIIKKSTSQTLGLAHNCRTAIAYA